MLKKINGLKGKKRGFTLIELIVVIAILAILASILIPSMVGYIGNAKQAVANADARSAYTAAQAIATQDAGTGTALPTTADAWNTAIKAYLGSNTTGTVTGVTMDTTDTNAVKSIAWTDGNLKTATYPVVS
ncbi:MAG: type II secretion system protein [Clostridia bacterium]|nr:type II secretion system protein [Clostridia bacterium]